MLPADSAARIRTLAKFVESDYAKIGRLLQIRSDYAGRLGKVERDIEMQKAKLDKEEREEMVEEWLSRRLDAGLYGVQITDLILAWLCAEDHGAKKQIRMLLKEQKLGIEVVRKTLQGMFCLIFCWIITYSQK